MKKLIYVTLIPILTACSSQKPTVRSQNSPIDNITSATKTHKEGVMQRKLDNWLENDWTPTIEKNTTMQKINKDKKRDFTLQEYVDKVNAYIKEKDSQKSDKE